VEILREQGPKSGELLMHHDDTGAMLREVAAGKRPATLRIYQPNPTVAFGRRDELNPGFTAAAQACRDLGYDILVRKVGGHAAAYHPGRPAAPAAPIAVALYTRGLTKLLAVFAVVAAVFAVVATVDAVVLTASSDCFTALSPRSLFHTFFRLLSVTSEKALSLLTSRRSILSDFAFP